MRRFHRRRRNRSHRGALVLLLLLLTVFLVSCVAGTDPLWLKDVFGVDVVHYDREAAVASCETDGETAQALAEMVSTLTTANSLTLTPFETASEAVSIYRDALLNDLLRDHYGSYSGNSAVLSTAGAAYAARTITTLIPKEDFENAALRYFGAVSVRHTGGKVFEYLSEANGYTSPLQAWREGVAVAVESLEETEHTYRMCFRLCDGELSSPLYQAVYVKRDSGDCYFYSLNAV